MLDEPNITLPLATSYNERGVAGFTHSITNSQDQRKINCFYELSKNPMTGRGTLTLSKRPGVTIESGTTYGVSSQVPFLILDLINASVASSNQKAVFNTQNSGADTKVSVHGIADVTILNSAVTKYVPSFVDITSISNVQNVVVQLRRAGQGTEAPHRVFFITVPNLVSAAAWTEIVDADFTTFTSHQGKMEHLDGYMFALTRNNLIINSDLNSLANWTATNFLAKQIVQDYPTGLARLSNRILAFGLETVEEFYNAGNTTGSPLGRIAQRHQKIGLVPSVPVDSGGDNIGTHYYATIESRLFFVGRRAGSTSVGVFSYDGSTYEKVSSVYVDKILSEKSTAIHSVNRVGFHGQSAVAISWTPAGETPHKWLMFFPDWKEWFEWTSTIFSPVNSGGYHLGVSQPDKIYSFDPTDNWQDDGTSYQWFTQFRLPSNGSSRNFMTMYGVDADTDTSANDLTVEASDDDTASFYTLGTIDQTRDRKIAFRGGSFRKRHIRLGNTNARPTRIHNFLARVNG